MSIFSQVKALKIKSSVFILSEEHLTTMNFGDLVPILCKEVLPKDKFKVSTELLIKLMPMRAPMFHKVTAYVHYFFVPRFQINSQFENFINPKVNTDNSLINAYIPPTQINSYGKENSSLVRSLSDYFALPVLNTGWLGQSANDGGFVDVDPFRAYQHIYNSYYRDQNMEVLEGANPATTSLFLVDQYKGLFGLLNNGNAGTSSGAMGSANYANQIKNLLKLRKRAWAKDYFTSALPSPQAGDDVLVPINAEISASGPMRFQSLNSTGDNGFSAGPVTLTSDSADDASDDVGSLYADDAESTGQELRYYDGLSALNTSTTINDLRRAMALQRFKELAERGGTRYSEMVRNFFGAFLKDYWVDRPIFLGGQKQIINVSEIFQTSATGNTTVGQTTGVSYLGERGGVGNSYGKTKTFTLVAPCHGYLFGILSVRPQAVYYQGLERMWTRKSIFDYAFPQFANLGEQEILNKELFANGDSNDDGIFGYTPRYAEYKVGHNHITGDFRDSLNYWHLGRTFAANARPTLSKEFVMMDNPSYNSFNVTTSTTAHLYVDLYNKIIARRPLPYFGTPSIL